MERNVAERWSEIADLNARFSLAVNTRDESLFRTLWTSDASWRIDDPIDFDASGIDSIAKSWISILRTYDFFAQTAHAGTVTAGPDESRASQRVTCNEWGRPSDGKSGYFNVGLYEDELQFESGVWKYCKRVYRYLYIDTTPLAGMSYFSGNASSSAHQHAIDTLRSAARGTSS